MYCATTENQKNLDSFGVPGRLMGEQYWHILQQDKQQLPFSLFTETKRRPVNKGISTTNDNRVGTQDHTQQQASSHAFKNIV